MGKPIDQGCLCDHLIFQIMVFWGLIFLRCSQVLGPSVTTSKLHILLIALLQAGQVSLSAY